MANVDRDQHPPNEVAEKTDDRGGHERQVGTRALTVDPAKLLISPRLANLSREHRLFYKLAAGTRFTGLKQWLNIYDSTFDDNLLPLSTEKISVEALITLCMNDYSSLNDCVGRVRRCWGVYPYDDAEFDKPMFFAARAWSDREREAYNSIKPSDRLRVSTVWLPFHWESVYTSIVAFRFLQPCRSQASENLYGSNLKSIDLKVAGEDLETAKELKARILIWLESRLFLTTMSELISLPQLQDERFIRLQLAHDGPILKTKDMSTWAEKGVVQVDLLFSESSCCKAWLDEHEIDGEEDFLVRLKEDVLDDKLTKNWCEEYDRLVPP